jgi:hypothetical protein
MPHLIEPAPTARAKCRGCGAAIAAGVLRFGESLPNPFGEGETLHWFHLDCAALKRPEPLVPALESAAEPVADSARLMADARLGLDHPRLQRINGAERDRSGRAQCRHCKTTIPKGTWRIALVFHEEGRFMPSGFIHVSCARPYFETDADVLPRVRHFAPALTEADVQEIAAELKTPPPEPGQ